MFLALPEIIPARKCKHRQSLLDFTKSKILTSRIYSEGYKRVLAQTEATQNEAKQKVAKREANKEIRRKEKEELAEQMEVRKENRAAKKICPTRRRRSNKDVAVAGTVASVAYPAIHRAI